MKRFSPWEQAIADHGQRAVPEEACGVLVTNSSGVLEAVALRNVHPNPQNYFTADASEYIPLLRAGVVVAYYHSHPHGPAEFSDGDKLVAEATKLPCYLYAVQADELVAYTPSGWCPPLEGRRFLPGVNDCLSLVRDWYRVELGLTIELPQRTTRMLLHGIPEMGELITSNGFARVTGQPERGDVLVMHIRAAGSRPNHVAVYVGEGLLLHQLANEPSGLAPWGGMWEHCTAMILRHEIKMPAAPPRPAGTDLSETMGTKLSPP